MYIYSIKNRLKKTIMSLTPIPLRGQLCNYATATYSNRYPAESKSCMQNCLALLNPVLRTAF